MAENTESTGTEQAQDEVLDLQTLPGAEDEPEVEAHTSTYSVTLCGTRAD